MTPVERFARAGRAELCVHDFGDPADPAVLLVQGAGAAMDWWGDDFCRRLAAGGRRVIRYDHRDTGASTTGPPGAPDYTGRDLAEDVVAVLDALEVARAHLVGLSMGGALVQVVALDHPHRVASLTLVATSPVGPGTGGLELPPMTDELASTFAGAGPGPDWTDRSAAIDHLVDAFRPYAGSLPFDEGGLRAVARRVADRSVDLASAGNHLACDPGPEPTRALGDLAVPTLVIHGTEDPLFPPAHGRALTDLIPGARLLLLEGAGHELPRATWDTVVPALLTHTASR